MNGKRALAGLAVLGVSVLVLSRLGGGGDPPPPETSVFAARRGTLPITLTETGTLNTRNAAYVKLEVEGNTKIAWLVEEGASVTSGDVVVELDKTECKKRLEDLESQKIQAKSDLKGAETERELQGAQNQTDSEKSRMALQVAWVQLDKLVYGEIPAEEKKRKLRIEKGHSALQKAEEKYKTMPGLLDLGFVTKAQVEEERLKVKEAEVELDAAEQDMELYEKFEKPLALKQKTADFTQAWREVWAVQQRTASQSEQKEAVVLQRELALKAIRARLAEERHRLESLTLRAPRPGVVIYGDPANPWNRDEIKVGAEVWQNRIIVTIPDTNEMMVTVQVHEADVNVVHSGMPTTVTLETYKDLVLHGAVQKVAAVATAGGWMEDVKKFRVDVALVGSNLNLRPGITAKAEISVGELKDVLHVPIQAVQTKEGTHRCWVRQGNRNVATEVEIGRTNDLYVEIKKGLAEGEQVLLYDPQGSDAGPSGRAPTPRPAVPAAPGAGRP